MVWARDFFVSAVLPWVDAEVDGNDSGYSVGCVPAPSMKLFRFVLTRKGKFLTWGERI
jgi:hypothetical protein